MNLRHKLLFFAVASLAVMGCPEPDDAGTSASSTDEAATDEATENSEPQPFSNPNDARFAVTPGTGVVLNGVFQYEGDITGSYRIDFQKQEGNAPPMLVHAIELDEPGPFSIEVPKNYGALHLLGFVDAQQDGPSADDPVGRSQAPIIIGEEDIEGVILEIAVGNTINPMPPPDSAPTPDDGGSADGEPAPEGEAPPADGGEAPADGGAPEAGGDEPEAAAPPANDEPAEPAAEPSEPPADE